MKFYFVKSDYLQYLKKFEPNLSAQKLKETRPYVGVVFSIQGKDFFAPLHSAKAKHEKISNKSIDCIKLYEHDKLLGVLNLNNMIPVSNRDVIPVDFKKYDTAKRNLFQTEYKNIIRLRNTILKNAERVYFEYKNNPQGNLAKRCYNFPLLEEKCSEYSTYRQNKKEKNAIQQYCHTISESTKQNVFEKGKDR